MEPDTTLLNALRRTYDTRPTGFSTGSTITYSVLSPEFAYQRLERPDANNLGRYPMGESDPKFETDRLAWTKRWGSDFSPATPAQMEAVDNAFAAWEKVLGVRFVPSTSNDAQIRIGTANTSMVPNVNGKPTAGYNARQQTGAVGDPSKDYNIIVIGRSNVEPWQPGSYAFELLLHEIGHALGLDHPRDYKTEGMLPVAPEDNHFNTLMSYLSPDYQNFPTHVDGYGAIMPVAGGNAVTPLRYDIAALQQKLGVNGTSGGDTIHEYVETFEYSNIQRSTLFDVAGIDRIDASSMERTVEINLEPGTSSAIGTPYGGPRNVTIAFNTWIENARGGSGLDLLYGNILANILDGGASMDTLVGGLGEDTYIIGSGLDRSLGRVAGADIIRDDGGILRLDSADGSLLHGSPTQKAKRRDKGTSGATDCATLWQDEQRSEIFYGYRTGTPDTLAIFRKTGTLYEQIAAIENFRNGTFGIDLKGGTQLALGKSTDSNPFIIGGPGKQQTTPVDLTENLGKTIKCFLNAPARAGDIVKLSLAGSDLSRFACIDGANQTSFADGDVTLQLVEGQTELAFAFVNTGDVDTDATLPLTATYQPLEGDTASNTLTLNFDATEEPDQAATSLTVNGDIVPTDIQPDVPGILAQGDAQGNPIGEAGAYEDILSGSAGNDHLLAGELNDDVGSGDGDDWIEGGNGQDYLHGETGNDRLYGNTQIDVAALQTTYTEIFDRSTWKWQTDAFGNEHRQIGCYRPDGSSGVATDVWFRRQSRRGPIRSQGACLLAASHPIGVQADSGRVQG